MGYPLPLQHTTVLQNNIDPHQRLVVLAMSIVVGLRRYKADAVEGARVYCGVVPWCMSLCMRCWLQYMGKRMTIIIKVDSMYMRAIWPFPVQIVSDMLRKHQSVH